MIRVFCFSFVGRGASKVLNPFSLRADFRIQRKIRVVEKQICWRLIERAECCCFCSDSCLLAQMCENFFPDALSLSLSLSLSVSEKEDWKYY